MRHISIKILWIAVVLAVLISNLVAASSVSHAPDTTAAPANATCPVLTDEPIDSAVFSDYQGQRVFFCCARCRRDFLRSPEKYLENLPQFRGTKWRENAVGVYDADSTLEEVEHEHAYDHGRDHHTEHHAAPQLIGFAGKFHPLVVHFPIALIMILALLESVEWVTGKELLRGAHSLLWCIAASSAVLSASLGWAAAAGSLFSAEQSLFLNYHRWIGTIVAILTVAVAYFSLKVSKFPATV